MANREITARVGKEDNSPSATVIFDMGEDLDSAVEKFGKDVVFKRFEQSLTIELQALIRRHLGGEKPKTQEEIQAIVDEFSPGLQRKRKTTKEKALDLLEGLSEEERAEILASLTG